MKKYLSILLIVLMCGVLVFGLASCQQDENTIRLNEVTHSIFYAPQYIAMELGYFEQEGLTIELTNGAGADNVMTAILSGEADIGLMGCEASIYVYLEGMKDYPKVVGQLTKRDGAFLVARTQDDNFDYTNIANSTVLMGRTGGMPAMVLQYILNNKGYTNGVNITMDYSIAFGSLAPAFAGGTGDYVPLFEPVASQMEKEGKGYIVSSLGVDSGEVPYTCYTVSAKLLNTQPQKVAKFLSAVWRAVEYVNTHTAKELAPLLKPYFDTDIDLIESAIDNYKSIDVWMDTPVTSESAFNRMQDMMENAGELSARVPYAHLIDTTIATQVATELAQ